MSFWIMCLTFLVLGTHKVWWKMIKGKRWWRRCLKNTVSRLFWTRVCSKWPPPPPPRRVSPLEDGPCLWVTREAPLRGSFFTSHQSRIWQINSCMLAQWFLVTPICPLSIIKWKHSIWAFQQKSSFNHSMCSDPSKPVRQRVSSMQRCRTYPTELTWNVFIRWKKHQKFMSAQRDRCSNAAFSKTYGALYTLWQVAANGVIKTWFLSESADRIFSSFNYGEWEYRCYQKSLCQHATIYLPDVRLLRSEKNPQVWGCLMSYSRGGPGYSWVGAILKRGTLLVSGFPRLTPQNG